MVAAASLLPPPRPAATGIRFSRSMTIRTGSASFQDERSRT